MQYAFIYFFLKVLNMYLVVASMIRHITLEVLTRMFSGHTFVSFDVNRSSKGYSVHWLPGLAKRVQIDIG